MQTSNEQERLLMGWCWVQPAEGLSPDVFASGEARCWRSMLARQEEQPSCLALKAGDAATWGGAAPQPLFWPTDATTGYIPSRRPLSIARQGRRHPCVTHPSIGGNTREIIDSALFVRKPLTSMQEGSRNHSGL